MDWGEQSQQMMRMWADAQQKMLQNWAAMARPGTAAPGGKGDGAPWTDWGRQWSDQVRKQWEQMAGGLGTTQQEVVQKLFSGEEMFVRFVEMCLGAMRTLAPKIDAGEDWSALLRRYLEQAREGWAQDPASWFTPDAATAATQEMPELLKLYMGQARSMSMPWMNSLQEARGHMGEAMSGDRRAFIKTFNLFMDSYEGTLGKLAAAPAIGYTREFQEKLTKAYETWLEVRRAEVEFRTETMNIFFRALENTVRELVEKGERGEKIDSFRELFDLWVGIAEKAYYEIASSQGFAEIQARMVNAAMHYRIHERGLAEDYLQALHLPTRSELDDSYRQLHKMRREIRALKSEVAQLRDAAAAATVAPAPAPAPTTSKTSKTRKTSTTSSRTRKTTRSKASAKQAADTKKKEG